jgi:hypothetical protein
LRRKNASHFFLSGAKKRRKQPERYVKLGLGFIIIIFVTIQPRAELIRFGRELPEHRTKSVLCAIEPVLQKDPAVLPEMEHV